MIVWKRCTEKKHTIFHLMLKLLGRALFAWKKCKEIYLVFQCHMQIVFKETFFLEINILKQI